VKNRFQSLPFKCNLQRYTEALLKPMMEAAALLTAERGVVAGSGARCMQLTCMLRFTAKVFCYQM
jgi:hypothetical protein